jgi:isochorismate synthase
VTAADRDSLGSAVFVLSRPSGTVIADGVGRRFDDARDAAQALRDGTVRAVVGALPFDLDDTAALVSAGTLTRSDQPWRGVRGRSRRVSAMTSHPDPDEHRERVGRAVAEIASGRLEKVVLARSVDLSVEPEVDVDELIGALAQGNSESNAFAVELGALRDTPLALRSSGIGETPDDGGAAPGSAWLLGASPESLVRKHGRVVTCQPYAGSAPRSADPVADRAAADALIASTKDLSEHAFVVDHLRDRLAPLCSELDAPTTPELRSTGEIWHLATPIRGVLRDESLTALDLALLLTPTPAVGGTPSTAAARFIRDVEGQRGLYGGAVGWCDEHGDGEWMVTIRCLELSADRRHLRTWAGGGIVAQSDPQAEVDETTAKLRTVFNALGLERA